MNFNIWFGEFIRSWDCGQSKVFGRIIGILNTCLLIFTYLAVKGFHLNWFYLIVVLVLFCVFILVTGFLYVKFNFLSSEQRSITQSNPEFSDLRVDVKRCIELLEKKELK